MPGPKLSFIRRFHCSYLGIDFSRTGACWDMHIRKLLDNGRKRVNQLHKVISNRNINLSARRHLLLSVIRPSIEYGSEVWEGNKSQAGSFGIHNIRWSQADPWVFF